MDSIDIVPAHLFDICDLTDFFFASPKRMKTDPFDVDYKTCVMCILTEEWEYCSQMLQVIIILFVAKFRYHSIPMAVSTQLSPTGNFVSHLFRRYVIFDLKNMTVVRLSSVEKKLL